MAIGRIREITFDDGAIVDGDDVTLADLLNPAVVGSSGIYLDNSSGLPTLSPWRAGVVAWDTQNKCMAVSLSYDGSWMQVGQEITDDAVNKSGGILANGTVVYYEGAQGNRPKMYKAYCTDEDIANRTIGLVTQDSGVAINAEGPVTTSGVVRNLNTNAFVEGDLLWLDTVAGQYTKTRPSVQYEQICIGIVIKSHLTQGEIYVSIKNITNQIAKMAFHTVDPHGWTEYDDTYMGRGWTGNTFTLTQIGTSTPYYCKGKLKYLTGNKSITVNPTAGAHFIGLNCTTEVLEDLGPDFPIVQAVSTHIITEFVYCSGVVVLYNANERHTTKFLKRDWIYKHLSFSTQYRSGITPSITSIDGNGSSIDHARYSVTTGQIADEDINITTAALTSSDIKSLWYYNPALSIWVKYSETSGTGVIPFGGTGRASYNSYSTGLVECTNNYHVLTHLFAANDGTVIGIIGNAEYNNQNSARTAAATEIDTLLTTGLPFPEFRAIATFINKTSNTYSNAVKSIIISADTGKAYIDWRRTALNPAAGQSATNHQGLSGLQGGQAGEYYHLSASKYAEATAGTIVTTAGAQDISNKDIDGGTASDDNRLTVPKNTFAKINALTDKEATITYATDTKKLYVNDGNDNKVIGGGLIVTPVTVSGTTPSIATLEAGKHYIVDMSTATGDVTVTAPTGASEANWKVTAARNWNNAYRLSIAAAGSDKFYYAGDSTTITVIRIYNPDGWVEGCYLTTNLWVLNTDENAGSGASGSGQGRKNYILNPSAATSFTDNWTATNLTVARDETSAIPRYTTTKTAFKLVSTNTNATFTSDARLLDDADLSRKLAGEIAINVADASNWTISVLASATAGGTYAALPLSTDVAAVTTLPATTGMFKFSFDTVASTPYIKFQIKSAATSKTAYFSDILLTPDGSTVMSPVVGATQSVTVTGSWTSNTTYAAKETRIGQLGKYEVKVSLAGAPNSAALVINLPTGRTIDTTALLNVTASFTVGKGIARDAGTSTYPLSVAYNTTTSLILLLLGASGTYLDIPGAVTQAAPFTFGNTDEVYLEFTVPISEFSGGTVNVSGNDIEFSYNSSTSTTDDTTSLAYGRTGAFIQSFAPSGTNEVVKHVGFLAPIQVGDQLLLEISRDSGVTWLPYTAAFTAQWKDDASAVYGMAIRQGTSTSAIVSFFSKANAGQAWSVYSGLGTYKWRVRKVSASSVAGFEMHKPGVSAGLVPAQGLDGRTDGVAVPAGKVGEVKEAIFATASLTSGAYSVLALTLGAGIWQVTGHVEYIRNGASITGSSYNAQIVPNGGGNPSDTAYFPKAVDFFPAAFSNATVHAAPTVVRCDGTNMIVPGFASATATAVQLRFYAGTFTSGPVQATALIRAVRIA